MNKSDIVKKKIIVCITDLKKRGEKRLPPERLLAQKLKTSRMTVSKALSDLEVEGRIERRRGSGNYIVDRSRPAGMTFGVAMRKMVYKSANHFNVFMNCLSKYGDSKDVRIQIFEGVEEEFRKYPDNTRIQKNIDAGLLDGLLVVSRMQADIVGNLNHKLPLVLINNIMPSAEITSVSCDQFRAGFLGAKYLLDCGHEKIGYVTNNFVHPESIEQQSGFRCALEAYGLKFTKKNQLATRENTDRVNKMVRRFFSETETTGIMVRNDHLAAKIIRILNDMGKRVPEDISVISYGNYPSGYNSEISLTTLDPHFDKMCKTGIDLLTGIIDGTKPVGRMHLLDPAIVVRESVRKIT